MPAADILTPNRFELERLTGLPCATPDDARQAAAQLQSAMAPSGPRVVLVTSLGADTPPGTAAMLAAGPDGVFLLRTPLLPLAVNGAGDAVAALFLFHFLQTRQARTALERAGSALYGVLRRTVEAGSRELLIVAAQEELVQPTVRFSANPA